MAATESKYCEFFIYQKYGFNVERVTFNQSISEEIDGKLSWFWQSYVGRNFVKGTFVLGEREEMREKTSDVDFSFRTTLITKPISIKLKQKQLSKEENPIQIKKAATAVYLSGIYKTQLKSVPKC